jgi:hypothetical protein
LGAQPSAAPSGAPTRKVGLGLGLGIFFLPIVFSWFTLRKGHSTLSKVLALGWCGLVFISMVSGKNDRSDQKAATVHAASTTTPVQDVAPVNTAARTAVPEQKEAPQKQLQLGERFQLGDFAYVVNKVTARKSVGGQFVNEKASDGAIFLIVDYTIENLGRETETVLTDDFKIRDSQGRTFSPSSDANTALAMSGKSKDLIVSQLQPGLKKNMSTAFEVPEEAAKAGATLIIPEKGFLGSKSAEIALRMK